MSLFSKESTPSVEALQKEHPGIYQEVIAAGEAKAQEGIETVKASAFDAGKVEGKTEGQVVGESIGAKNELARVLAVKASCMPGHEKLIAALIEDGKTTGPEAAEQVVKAENEKRATGLGNLKEEAPAPVKAENVDSSVPPAKTPDDALKAAWDGKDGAALKAEFGEKGYESFVAYYKNDATFMKTGKIALGA